MIRDVFCFTPVLRLEPETVQAIFALEWDGALTVHLQRDNPSGGGIADHLHQYVRGREAFLAGRYDAMLVIESDIIPPPDTLKKLAALDVDCAYGVYAFRATKSVINVFERYPDKPDGRQPRNEGESLSLHPKKLRAAVKAGKTRMTGGGLGCALIKRHVLEAIPFTVINNGGYCDTPFNRAVMRRGLMQMADMTIICGHKDKDGTLFYPELPDGEVE